MGKSITGGRVQSLLKEAALVTWLPWLLARVAVTLALIASKFEVTHFTPLNSKAVELSRNGLLGYDAGWYQSIAANGYGGSGYSSERFYPLFPLLIKSLHLLTPFGWSFITVVLANAMAFVAGMALYLLVKIDLKDTLVARRSVWLLCLAPISFSLVFGYAESMLLVFAILTLLFLRRKAWWWAGLFGLLAATTRPLGLLLVAPALIEVVQSRKELSGRRVIAGAAAVLGPIIGTMSYLTWVAIAFGDFWAPIKIQQRPLHHGPLTNPLVVLYHAVFNLFHGHHIGTALHLPWICLAIVLIVVAFRRLPLSYAVFSLAIVLVALSGSNLDSFERYLLSAFPLIIVAAGWLRAKNTAVIVLSASAIVMSGYAFLTFQGLYVP